MYENVSDSLNFSEDMTPKCIFPFYLTCHKIENSYQLYDTN